MDLSDWIKCHADTTPDKPAILFEGGEISYASLARLIDSCVRVLLDGIGAIGLLTWDRIRLNKSHCFLHVHVSVQYCCH